MFSVHLYGIEALTLTESTTKKLKAFWLFRKMLRISWTQKITKVEVLRRVNKDLKIFNSVKTNKLKYLSRIMQNEDKYGLIQRILQGRIGSWRVPARREISWLTNLRAWFNKIKSIVRMIANLRNGEAAWEEEEE